MLRSLRVAVPALATLLFTSESSAQRYPIVGEIERLDPSFTALVPADARIEKLADGFAWSEGPVWRRSGNYLLFSDIPKNTIYQWDAVKGLTVFLRPAGYIGATPRVANSAAMDSRSTPPTAW